MIGERKGKRRRIRGWREYTHPSQNLLSSPLFFFLRRVIFRFTILIMMILERRGGGGGRRGEDDGRLMRLFALSFLFFFYCYTSRGEREKEIEKDRGGGSSMTNFPFFYGSINLTGGGLWGRVEILLAL